MSDVIESPCIAVCQMHPDEKICHGCRRTLEEIARWGRMTPAERRQIMDELPARQHTALSDN